MSDDHYPFARKVGHVWLIGLNSAVPNFWLWDASGPRRPGADSSGSSELCATLDGGPRIVVSHYPLLMQGHKPEPRVAPAPRLACACATSRPSAA